MDAYTRKNNIRVTLRWIPGHAGIEGNELAHQLAREIYFRAPSIPWPNPTSAEDAATYKKQIAEHYKNIRENRTTLPKPHPSISTLSTEQAHILRKVQTNTCLTPLMLYNFRWQGTAHCPNCPEVRSDTDHILYACNHCATLSLLPVPIPSLLECLAQLGLGRPPMGPGGASAPFLKAVVVGF
ncbi:uncharacterized protein ISCGN_026045 [Ixodes scapularis]